MVHHQQTAQSLIRVHVDRRAESSLTPLLPSVVSWICEVLVEEGGVGEGRRETSAQLVHLVIPLPAPACMSAYLLICSFVPEADLLLFQQRHPSEDRGMLGFFFFPLM